MTATVTRHPSSRRPDRELFGEWLRQKRYDADYTQGQIVRRLRTKRSQGWLSRFERGKFLRLMPVEEFRDLCRILNINPAEMLVVCGFQTHEEVGRYLTAFAERRRASR